MWTNTTKPFSVGGKVGYSTLAGGFQPLPRVSVDIYRIILEDEGFYSFLRLNSLPAITNNFGDFTFTDLPVQVQTKMVTPGGFPGTPIEIVKPDSLPDIVFLISGQGGAEYFEIYDERNMVDPTWLKTYTSRVNVPLTGSPTFTVNISDLRSTTPTPDSQFYFLRVGRVTREEITNVSDPEPGYMTSVPSSFFPGIVDAPFGGTLHIGGRFGEDIEDKGDSIYYRLDFSPYSGDPAAPFDATSATQITDVLDNKKYILPTSPTDPGRWERLSLGPFTAQVVGGSSIQVYQRPSYDSALEYMPFPDLMAKWNTKAADNDLVIVSITVYKKVGEVGDVPQLIPMPLDATVNKYEFLPLRIDNRPPVPTVNSWETGFATFSPPGINSLKTMDCCSEMEVTVGDLDGNECMVLGYNIEDGSGNPHPHLRYYRIGVAYSPKQVGVVPLETQVTLKGQGSDPTFDAGVGKNDIDWNYDPVSDPLHSNIVNYSSVLVPQTLDGWPPEPAGDTYSGSQCEQYAAEVSLGCAVRTINGWSRLFGHRHTSRHIIIKKKPETLP